jgi:menaquinone-specific isochorismate synthase
MLFYGPWTVVELNSATSMPGGQSGGYDLFFQDFFGETEKALCAQNPSPDSLNSEELKKRIEPFLSTPRGLHLRDFLPPSQDHFEESFRVIQGKIQREEIEKAVPIVFSQTEGRPGPADLAHFMMQSLQYGPELFPFGFWNHGRGVFGATPEFLFRRQAMVVESMALAGSCPKSEKAERMPLLKDPKELREHELVVNDLTTRLKALGWLQQHPTEVIELPNLLHLRTRFELTGCTKPDIEMVRHLHPTAALGVAPRAYGFSWLRELPEQSARGLFGAPMLFRVSPDESICLVAIRSLTWDEQGSRIGAGCGIVRDSQLEREWREALAKIEFTKNLLAIAE